MNEMLRSLGFGQVYAGKWTNGSTMTILVGTANSHIHCIGDVSELSYVDYVIKKAEPETMKRHVEKFMRMVGKCIQVYEE